MKYLKIFLFFFKIWELKINTNSILLIVRSPREECRKKNINAQRASDKVLSLSIYGRKFISYIRKWVLLSCVDLETSRFRGTSHAAQPRLVRVVIWPFRRRPPRGKMSFDISQSHSCKNARGQTNRVSLLCNSGHRWAISPFLSFYARKVSWLEYTWKYQMYTTESDLTLPTRKERYYTVLNTVHK